MPYVVCATSLSCWSTGKNKQMLNTRWWPYKFSASCITARSYSPASLVTSDPSGQGSESAQKALSWSVLLASCRRVINQRHCQHSGTRQSTGFAD